MSDTGFISYSAEDIANKLIEFAENKYKMLIITHRNPDGDAVGSAFALKRIYEKLSGIAICGCTHEIPGYLRFISDQESIKIENTDEFDIIVTVDTASPGQMGDLEHLANNIEFAIDHHGSFTQYSNEYRNKNASAAGEMVYHIYKELINRGKIESDADICRKIYSAISADTGSFQYSNTTKETHIIAAELISYINNDSDGMDTATIARLLHNSRSLTSLKAQKLCIDALNLTEDGKIAYITLEKKKMKAYGLDSEDFSTAIDIPRSVEGVELAFVLKETSETDLDSNKIFKISSRSSSDVSVAKIMQKFGGGGHDKAAGGSINARTAAIATETVLKEFIKALEGEK